jgi:hypothetical protein
MPTNAHITIARTADADVRQRQVIVAVDHGPKARLVFGESVTFDVPPGAHTLRANNTLIWKSVPFTAAAGEHVEFVVANRATRFMLGFLSIVGVAPLYLTIERRPKPF